MLQKAVFHCHMDSFCETMGTEGSSNDVPLILGKMVRIGGTFYLETGLG